jgi:diguanylate cyclase (GGDEF)-like protein
METDDQSALTDEALGLPSRVLYDDRLQQALLRASHQGQTVAVLSLSIDNLELLAHRLGQDTGLHLMAEVARRLRPCLAQHDTLARNGADCFLALASGLQRGSDVMPLCEDLVAALAPALLLNGQSLHASASIGIALYPQDSSDAATLLLQAGQARDRARDQGGARYQFFSEELNRRTLERIGTESALRLALARDELQLLYQPLADLQSGAVASLEALVRWQHPVHGLLAAHHFIPLAEEAGMTDAIGAWVLRRACRDLRAWTEGLARPLTVAINISPSQFRAPPLAATVAAALAEHGLAPSVLMLEITETALQHAGADGDANLAALKALGLNLTLDDFGTGQSSLSSLKRFPFDAVKIDRAFIRNVVSDSGDAALCKTIISMAHHLGMKVVAEGVETEGQCDFLRRNMCDMIQGYFFAPALAPDGIDTLLRDARVLPPHLLRMQKPQRRLLLVDDEQNIVSALKRLLRQDQYQIYTANSGQQGLDVLAEHAVDVIVSDQRMPGMLGADFLRKARQLYPETIRIMLSGYTELQSVTDAVNEGAIYKFLTKPWEDELLRGHIAEAFHLKEIADDNLRLNLEVRTANQELASANRRMEQLLQEKQRQISRDEISLSVARELLQHLPLAVIGMDDDGMIAFVNGAADQLFGRSGALLGNEASLVLPQLFPGGAPPLPGRQQHRAVIEGQCHTVLLYPMGEHSSSRGSLIVLSRCEDPP